MSSNEIILSLLLLAPPPPAAIDLSTAELDAALRAAEAAETFDDLEVNLEEAVEQLKELQAQLKTMLRRARKAKKATEDQE